MKRIRTFALNVALLTITSLVMRSIAVGFNVYISGKLGDAGMGLFTLVMSVYGFSVTLALSGVNLAATRLTAEAAGHESDISVRVGMRRCLTYGASFGLLSGTLLFTLAEPIGLKLLNDARTLDSLRILAFSLPFVSISSAVSGYFTAVRRVAKSSSSQVVGQLVRIMATAWLLSVFLPSGIGYACFAVSAGAVISETVTFVYIYILYRHDLKNHYNGPGALEKNITHRLFGIAIPVALTTYVRSGLLTVEHLLIPVGLRKHGDSGERSLATYGVLHGMVFPIVLFPMSFLSAFAGMLVPELAEAKARGNFPRINGIASRVYQISLLFAVGIAGYMMSFSVDLGYAIYNNGEAAEFIRIMAPLIPVMYIDHITDGMLKGLGEQLYIMRVNIFDASLSCLLVWIVLPMAGIKGYVAIIFIAEIINTALSIARLLTIVELKCKIFRWLILPLLCIAGSASCIHMITEISDIVIGSPAVFFILRTALTGVLYVLFLRLTNSLSGEDARWIRSIFVK
ncbi:MAG: oligosaccharide flippase family protein [Eubacteriales bacterium]|nr:oligosaccharide flippase family protein [Eubacteriales bacterium]